MFYFERQTGLIRDVPPAYSNFYNYLLRKSAREDIEKGIAEAKLKDGELVYPDWFDTTLEKWVDSTDKLLESAAKLRMPMPERAQ